MTMQRVNHACNAISAMAWDNKPFGQFALHRLSYRVAREQASAWVVWDRCGYGSRLPLLVISPYARANFVDHTAVDQTSILRFIEDNWSTGRIGNQSYDAIAGTLESMFDFAHLGKTPSLTLDPCTGEPA